MLKLKGCPKCKGDLIIERDFFSWYEQCIQCGYQHDLRVSSEERENGKTSIARYARETVANMGK